MYTCHTICIYLYIYIYMCIYMYHNGNIVDNMCFFCRSVLPSLFGSEFWSSSVSFRSSKSGSLASCARNSAISASWASMETMELLGYPSYIIENNVLLYHCYYCMKPWKIMMLVLLYEIVWNCMKLYEIVWNCMKWWLYHCIIDCDIVTFSYY